MKSKTVLFILISLYLTFPFLINGIVLPLQIVTYGGCTYVIIKKIKFLKNCLKQSGDMILYQKCIISWCIILLLSLVYPIMHSTYDFSYYITVLNELKVVVRMMAVYLLACFLYKRNITNIEYYTIFVKVNCLYILSTCIFLLLPSCRAVWNSIIFTPAVKDLDFDILEYYTRYGLQGFSGFQNTCFCAISIIFTFYIIERRRVLGKSNKIQIVYLICLYIGTMFYGRIGLLISIGVAILYVCYLILLKGKITILLYSLILISIFSVVIWGIISSSQQAEIWFNWAYEPFVNYYYGNDLESASSNRLKEMWEMPSIETILLGDGRYVDPKFGNYYMHTDVGYLRNLFYFGLFPSIVVIYCYYCAVSGVYPKHLRNMTDKLFLMLLFGAGLTIEAKGEFVLFLVGILFPLFFTRKTNDKILKSV